MNKTAVFPGSFDPFTIGHKEIVNKIFPIFDKIIIAVGENRDKKCFFSLNQRINFIEKIFDEEKILVKKYTGLTTNFCKKSCNIRVDFPIPGSPPSKINDPGTIPPPSTLLSSLSVQIILFSFE